MTGDLPHESVLDSMMFDRIMFGDPDRPAGGGLLPETLEAAGFRIVSIGYAPSPPPIDARGIHGLRDVYGPRTLSGTIECMFEDEAALRRVMSRYDVRHVDTPKPRGKRARRRNRGKGQA